MTHTGNGVRFSGQTAVAVSAQTCLDGTVAGMRACGHVLTGARVASESALAHLSCNRQAMQPEVELPEKAP